MKIRFILFAIFISTTSFTKSSVAEDLVKEAFTQMDKKKWSEAGVLAKRTNNKTLTNIILSQQFLDSTYNGNNFTKIIQFLHNNPKWPGRDALTLKAEEYLNYDTDKKIILEWFSKHSPLTGKGYKFYALAASKLVADPKILYPIIRNAWVYGDFTDKEEQKYYAQWRQCLCMADHLKKIDEQLWKSNVKVAQRSMHLVSKEYQNSFKAQIVIINKSSSADRLFKEIPEKYYTPGLLFRYLDSKKRQTPSSKSIALFKKVKVDKKHSEEWCRLQLYYAREFIDHKDFTNSYKIMNIPFAMSSDTIREQEWLAGWLALSFLHKPDQALVHFQKFIKVVKTPMSSSRGYYWLARSYEAKGDKNSANKFYHKAVEYSYTFYGQAASMEIRENKIILPRKPKMDEVHKKALAKNMLIQAIKLLTQYDQRGLAVMYIKAAIEQATPEEIVLITEYVKANYPIHQIISVARIATQHRVFIKDCAFPFPVPYKITNESVGASLTYSIIRQESSFEHAVISYDKGMGLMQLMDGTARNMARSIGIKYDSAKLTQDPRYNIALGTHYLKLLLEQFDNSYVLAIASYNAGPHRSQSWIERFGDPRTMKDTRKIIDWIELIPFSGTRNYVQRVFENMEVYRSILNKDSRLYLKQDLRSGGA